jgi:hypothetical protein
MKASYSINEKLGYIVTIFEGSVTLSDLGAHVESIWADPAWKNDFNGILDFSAASLDMSESEIQGLTKAMESDPRCSFGKWAFVVATAADFAKIRKVDLVADINATLRIFFDRRSALEWLLTHKPSGGPLKKPS